MTWNLKRTVQCAKCPWRKDVDPRDIPDGYDVEKHKALAETIATPEQFWEGYDSTMKVMACHETEDAHCIGWLMNQLGPGNNIALRIHMLSCKNASKVRTIGDQHETFKDTLPKPKSRRRK
jgi:hypothetical protein